jgi:regulator of protease activity HflC (stomatin/prohibitin superfamily)
MKLKKLAIISSLICGLSACERVPPGYRGVLVNMMGDSKGVSEQSVGIGWQYTGFQGQLYLFPTFLQNHSWHEEQAITVQTSEGLSITTDVGITYQIKEENVVKVFTKYRLGVKEITDTFLHNMVRDAMNEVASTMTVDQIYGIKKEEFIQKVNKLVKDAAAINGIDVDKIYLMGSFRLPESVRQSIDAKIQASQNAIKVENEVATSRAEAMKRIVEAEANAKQIIINAESQAKANKILAESITPEFVQYQAILKWNGMLPTTNASNVVPFINIGTKHD